MPASDSGSDFITTDRQNTENLLRPVFVGVTTKNAKVIIIALGPLRPRRLELARRLPLCDPGSSKALTHHRLPHHSR
jgi:hypothetical protein